jgi:hypothetical protein
MTKPATLAAAGSSENRTGKDLVTTIPAATDTITAPVLAGAPCRRRSLWLAVVRSCPHCGNMHSHRSGSRALFDGSAERACPQTGRPYLLTVGDGHG